MTQNHQKNNRVKMCKPVPNIDFYLLSKRKSLLSLNKSMGLDPFNTKALEFLPAAINSAPQWDKWGETQQHHRFIHQRGQRVEFRVGVTEQHKRLRTVCIYITGRSAVCAHQCLANLNSFIDEARPPGRRDWDLGRRHNAKPNSVQSSGQAKASNNVHISVH